MYCSRDLPLSRNIYCTTDRNSSYRAIQTIFRKTLERTDYWIMNMNRTRVWKVRCFQTLRLGLSRILVFARSVLSDELSSLRTKLELLRRTNLAAANFIQIIAVAALLALQITIEIFRYNLHILPESKEDLTQYFVMIYVPSPEIGA
ncbi:hypothetical protein V1527DRAFT_516536 [Lipomyces starkeyi]